MRNRNRIQRTFIFLLSMLVMTASHAKNYLIVPGASVGEIRLGMTRIEVHQQWGVPRSEVLAEEQDGLAGDVWDEVGERWTWVRYLDGKVVEISINSPKYHTKSGIAPEKSGLSAIKKTFKKLSRSVNPLDEGAMTCLAYVAYDRGISFMLCPSEDGSYLGSQLVQIVIFYPEPGR